MLFRSRELIADLPGLDAPRQAFCLWLYAFNRLQTTFSQAP